MSTDRDWHSFNREWRNKESERRFDRVLNVLNSIVFSSKKSWRGISFGALVVLILLAPDNKISYAVRDLFYALQDVVVQALDALTDAINSKPGFGYLLIFTIVLLIIIVFRGTKVEINERELEKIRTTSQEERFLILIKTITESSRSSGLLSLILTFLAAWLGWMFAK